MPRGAPSRSTLKLAEAFLTFLGDDAVQQVGVALAFGWRTACVAAAAGHTPPTTAGLPPGPISTRNTPTGPLASGLFCPKVSEVR
jgi:hypothetical protein